MWKKTSNASIIRSTSIDNKTLLHQRVSISTKIIFDLFDFGVNVSCSKRLRSSDSGKFNYCMQYSTSVWHRVSTISFSNVNPFLANAVITYPQKTLQSFSSVFLGSIKRIFLVRIFSYSDWIRTRITPNTYTIHAVKAKVIIPFEATIFILQHVKTENNISLQIYSGYIKGNIDLKWIKKQ